MACAVARLPWHTEAQANSLSKAGDASHAAELKRAGEQLSTESAAIAHSHCARSRAKSF
jgi:hypothetical protein